MQRSRLPWRVNLAIAAAISLLTLAACSPSPDPSGIGASPQRGIPSELSAALPTPSSSTPDGYFGQDGPLAARLPENKIGVVTWGSSTCPPLAASITTEPDNVVELTFEPSKNNVCTDDLGPSSHIVELPENAPTAGFTLRIRYNGSSETKDLKIS
ncbi:hypothetical protein [Arthrobacter russicus]|uniref:Lipoprotein n=1 Tax=Arthrobacter russicus TaxID=172040 RepID=A0ABU1JEP9_9MICC|nr:hypothetical protein [Arthrobacter russicus]MDR6270923.1 hypothetical protein [Arthrobacter russicus]